MNLNLAGTVILYHPKEEDLDNLKSYLFKIDRLYVYDNSAKKTVSKFILENEKINYFWDGENYGLSIRLNQACQQAILDGFDYLLTMDQDSSFLEKNLDCYIDAIVNFKEKEKTAVYGLEYDINDSTHETPDFIEVDHLITSASILNLKLFNEIGKFDENLFIDGVDIDYCYAALSRGYKNIKFGKIEFNHSLGIRTERSSIFNLYIFKKNVSLHSSIRVYYMYRNMLYIKNKYKKMLPKIIKKFEKNQIHQINKNIKYSDEFFTVLNYYFKAKRDFKNHTMGKISE